MSKIKLENRDHLVEILVGECLDGLYIAEKTILLFCFERDGVVHLESPERADYVRLKRGDVRRVAVLDAAVMSIGALRLEIGSMHHTRERWAAKAAQAEAEARHELNARAAANDSGQRAPKLFGEASQ